jgi:hypothetical protein
MKKKSIKVYKTTLINHVYTLYWLYYNTSVSLFYNNDINENKFYSY